MLNGICYLWELFITPWFIVWIWPLLRELMPELKVVPATIDYWDAVKLKILVAAIFPSIGNSIRSALKKDYLEM